MDPRDQQIQQLKAALEAQKEVGERRLEHILHLENRKLHLSTNEEESEYGDKAMTFYDPESWERTLQAQVNALQSEKSALKAQIRQLESSAPHIANNAANQFATGSNSIHIWNITANLPNPLLNLPDRSKEIKPPKYSTPCWYYECNRKRCPNLHEDQKHRYAELIPSLSENPKKR